MSARLLAACGAVLLSLTACERPPAVAPLGASPADPLRQTYWSIPDFTLTERTGAPVTLADLRGKVWVADFFFTTCPGPCPIMTSRLSDLHRELGADDRVRLVSISSDPAKDAPEVLRQYADKFGANQRWLFLTGEKRAIYHLAQHGFRLPIAEDPGAPEPIIHSTRLILIDSTGAIRGLYEGVGGEGTAPLLRDIRRLLAPAP